jgi:hypothetical protein
MNWTANAVIIGDPLIIAKKRLADQFPRGGDRGGRRNGMRTEQDLRSPDPDRNRGILGLGIAGSERTAGL